MKKSRLICRGSVMAAALIGSPVAADISPQQAWGDLQAYLEGFGYSVSGTETASGDTLTVSDVTLSIALPEDGGMMTMSIPELSYTDRGDGSVSLMTPDSTPITVAMAPEGEQVEITVTMTHVNFDTVISGDPGALRYDYAAEEIGLSLTGLMVDGAPVGRNVARFDMKLGALEGMSMSTGTDLRTIAQETAAEVLTYDFAFSDPGSSDSGLFNGQIDGMSYKGSLSMPADMDPEDMRAALDAGFAVDGMFATSGSRTEMTVSEDGGATNVRTSSGGGSLGVKLGADGVAYSVLSRAVTLAMSGPEIPLPIEGSADEISASFAIPLTPAQEPQDVALGLTVAGLQVSDLLWNIFDQGQVLPRDPLTVSVDMVGKATLMADLTDPEAIDQLPAIPNALTLRNLLVQGAGAKVTGDGDVVFDMSDMQSFPGMPAPEGTVNVQIEGANGLIDKLIAMGLMSQEDAMGGRMMMGMFTVPGEGEDNLKSTIVITPEGQVLANGQRIK